MELLVRFNQSGAGKDSKIDIGQGICFGLCMWLVELAHIIDEKNEFERYLFDFARHPGKLMEVGSKYQIATHRGTRDELGGLVCHTDLARIPGRVGETFNLAYSIFSEAPVDTNKVLIFSFYGVYKHLFYNSDWGHATVLLKKTNTLYWFDPNFGLYRLDNDMEILTDLSGFITKHYPSITSGKISLLNTVINIRRA